MPTQRNAAPAGSTPFGVYVHWPFCAQKCPYCDFNSHVRHGGWDEERFVAAYGRELEHVAALMRSNPEQERAGNDRSVQEGSRDQPRVGSIFIGGGTPSLMKPGTVAAILDRIASLWPLTSDVEITLEANPGSVEAGRFAGYRSAGVNRISMGLQSLLDDELRKLGRIHSVAEAKAALAIARRTFERVSFDLIYARPGHEPDAWRRELREALALAEGHLSLYQLTIEPGTPFEALHRSGRLAIPDGDRALELYEITQEMTDAAGLPAYEISNHARPGEESRHNLLYWRYGAYAGVGPGAHGRLMIGGARHATIAERSPEQWAGLVEERGHGFSELTPLTPAEQADEMLLMGLRLVAGLDLDRLERVTGARPADAVIAELEELGLLERGSAAPRQAACVDVAHGGDDPLEEFASIRACAGPGLAPEASRVPAVIRASPQGRLVLNELIYRLSQTMDRRQAAAAP